MARSSVRHSKQIFVVDFVCIEDGMGGTNDLQRRHGFQVDNVVWGPDLDCSDPICAGYGELPLVIRKNNRHWQEAV